MEGDHVLIEAQEDLRRRLPTDPAIQNLISEIVRLGDLPKLCDRIAQEYDARMGCAVRNGLVLVTISAKIRPILGLLVDLRLRRCRHLRQYINRDAAKAERMAGLDDPIEERLGGQHITSRGARGLYVSIGDRTLGAARSGR